MGLSKTVLLLGTMIFTLQLVSSNQDIKQELVTFINGDGYSHERTKPLTKIDIDLSMGVALISVFSAFLMKTVIARCPVIIQNNMDLDRCPL